MDWSGDGTGAFEAVHETGLRFEGEVRHLLALETPAGLRIVVVRNDASPLVFEPRAQADA